MCNVIRFRQMSSDRKWEVHADSGPGLGVLIQKDVDMWLKIVSIKEHSFHCIININFPKRVAILVAVLPTEGCSGSKYMSLLRFGANISRFVRRLCLCTVQYIKQISIAPKYCLYNSHASHTSTPSLRNRINHID